MDKPQNEIARLQSGEGQSKNTSAVILNRQSAAVNQLPLPDPATVKGRTLGALLRGERLTHLDCWKRFGSARLSHHAYILRGIPPQNFSVQNVGLAPVKIDAAMESVMVTIARDDEKTGRLDFRLADLELFHSNDVLAKQNVPQKWEKAILESVNNMAIFQNDAAMKVNLSVKILKLEINHLGFPDKTTTTEARYEITDRKTGDLIFTQNITATGVVNISYSINGSLCVKESVNRAVQNNISQFLAILKAGDVKQSISRAISLAEEVKQRKQADIAQKATEAKEQARLDAIRKMEEEKQAMADEAKAKRDALQQAKQDRLDAIKAKREAEKQAKQDKLDEIKTKREAKRQEKIRLAEEKRRAKEGDGSADDITCKSYGARPGSEGYVNCRIQLSRTKQAADDLQTAQIRTANEQRAAQKAAQIRAENEQRAAEVARQEEQARRDAADEQRSKDENSAVLANVFRSFNDDNERMREENNRSSTSISPPTSISCRNEFGNINCTTN